ncbi:copper amine oxidase N-terminal domain-containing protein [Paenibacillus polymyxa]|uniref:copper amine oxidase N-terminal domain-containing protein n=1 Tax=Paenibacillus polymyxa TaxID=1406 RepID=UPI00035FFE54|nr:copper amine oxidase N-terminal domain-containing protein [Paenibacillus polymyxa]NMP11870.1 copper amine oxidase N-terminal domain-containing protein [Paenibacillus polymyxa]
MLKRAVNTILFAVICFVTVDQANAALPKYLYNLVLTVNNVEVTSDVNPYIERATNTTYVPIRFVSESLGESVSWNREKQEVTIFSEHGEIVRLTIGSKVAYVNDIEKIMPNAPVMPVSPNRVMVPLRWVSEAMGATVDSTLKNETIHINITNTHLSKN